MRYVTSYFDFTLYKKDLIRFSPLLGAYTALWVTILPLNALISLTNEGFGETLEGSLGWATRQAFKAVLSDSIGLSLAVVFGAVWAVTLWSYLYNNRSANMMHTLPVRREGHFLTHYLAGITFFTIPHILIFLLTLLVELAAGSVDAGSLLIAMGIQTLLCLFFFSFATLCAMLTGHIWALPVFYFIFNFLAIGLFSLLEWMSTQFIFGFNSWLTKMPVVRWLTPISNLRNSMGYDWVVENDVFIQKLHGIDTIWIYAGAGLVMAGLALILYRVRHMETVGEVIALPWLCPVFKYSVSLCVGIALGCVVYEALDMDGIVPLLVCLVFWAVAGYFAALMLLNKSFRVFRQGWKGCTVMVCALLALCIVLEMDLFGVERRVPDREDVASLDVWGIQSAPFDEAQNLELYQVTDPELIQKVIDLHQMVVDHKDEVEGAWHRDDGVEYATGSLRVEYSLKNGGLLTRNYNILPLNAPELEQSNTITYAVNNLVSDKIGLDLSYKVKELETYRLAGIRIDHLSVPQTGESTRVSLILPRNSSSTEIEDMLDEMSKDIAPASTAEEDGLEIVSTPETLEGIKQAVLSDLADGNLGKRYLFYDSEERMGNTCRADVMLYYEETVEYEIEGRSEFHQVTRPVTVTLTPHATKTLTALKNAGVFDTGLILENNNLERVELP